MKKIMFNDKYGLTAAVLNGRKTMTRRLLPIRIYNKTDWKAFSESNYKVVSDDKGNWLDIRLYVPYRIGQVLAIAQSYNTLANSRFCSELDMIDSRTTFKKEHCGIGWNNKMFVRAELMPSRIKITDMFFEPLQEISDEDCLREGVEKWINKYIVTGILKRNHQNNVVFDTPRAAFAALINRTCGSGTWEKNPWVVSYKFKLIKEY